MRCNVRHCADITAAILVPEATLTVVTAALVIHNGHMMIAFLVFVTITMAHPI
jgi:hypothetical protein